MNGVQMAPCQSSERGTNTGVNRTRRSRVVREIAIGYVAVSALLIALGMVLTRVIQRSSLMAWDTRFVRDFSLHRTRSFVQWSSRWSFLADAPSIVAVGAAVVLLCAIRRKWLHVLWIATVLALELGVFLTVSYIVGRDRPNVAHLGSVPSTGSFPSGHIAATITLYGTIALMVHLVTRNRWARGVAWAWTVTAATMVGWARVYRGMHHPLDVGAGALLGTAICAIGWRAFCPGTTGPNTERRSTNHVSSNDSKEHR